MDRRLFLDIKICESSAILKLLAGEDEALLVGRDAFFVLDLCLYILNSVAGLNLECDRLSSQGLDEDLHFTINQGFVFSNLMLRTRDLRSSSRRS